THVSCQICRLRCLFQTGNRLLQQLISFFNYGSVITLVVKHIYSLCAFDGSSRVTWVVTEELDSLVMNLHKILIKLFKFSCITVLGNLVLEHYYTVDIDINSSSRTFIERYFPCWECCFVVLVLKIFVVKR